jgi:hypothetical protein
MTVLKAIWAIIVGTFVAVVLGMAYDYFHPEALNPENYKFMYPWFTGLPGFISGIIVAIMLNGGAQPAAKSGQAAKADPAKGGKTAAKGAKSEAVPGMPSFDFEKAKAEIAKPTDASPAAVPPASSTAGRRPADAVAPPKPPEGQKQ